MSWIRLRDQEPPANTPLFILVDGDVREGYIDEVLLLGNVLPTRFQTLRFPKGEYQCRDQHSYWGFDPYWMLCPPKPAQEKDTRTENQQWADASARSAETQKQQMAHLPSMSDADLRNFANGYVQGPLQERAREILAERGA